MPACAPAPVAVIVRDGRGRPVLSPRPARPAAASPYHASNRLLSAFSVLRREPTSADELPVSARRRLDGSGASFDPAAARLLRTTPRGGRAWIVPVADVDVVACGSPVPAFVRGRPPKLVVPRIPAGRPRPPHPPAPKAIPAPPVAAPSPPVPAPAVPRPRLDATEPREGVIVIATGNAPSGGGALADLLRGRAAAAVEPCLGPGGDLVAVSGVVPDGVTEAFLTNADGTAIKTTVTDNAYSFVVAPPGQRPRRRYVVWTKDGAPRVVPVTRALTMLERHRRCVALNERQRPLRVTSGG